MPACEPRRVRERAGRTPLPDSDRVARSRSVCFRGIRRRLRSVAARLAGRRTEKTESIERGRGGWRPAPPASGTLRPPWRREQEAALKLGPNRSLSWRTFSSLERLWGEIEAVREVGRPDQPLGEAREPRRIEGEGHDAMCARERGLVRHGGAPTSGRRSGRRTG